MSKSTVWTIKKIKALGVVTDVVTAGNILGIGRSVSYDLVKNGAFPAPLISVGSRHVVPVAGLLRILHATEPPPARLDHTGDPSVHVHTEAADSTRGIHTAPGPDQEET